MVDNVALMMSRLLGHAPKRPHPADS